MQLELPFLRSPEYPAIRFVRVPRARRYVLRVGPDGGLRLTVPRWGSRAEGLRFVDTQQAWIARERARLADRGAGRAWTTGTTILLRGRREVLVVTPSGAGATIAYGDRLVRIPSMTADVRPFVEADLRGLARDELIPRLLELARQQGLTVSRVTIRNQQSRWGSCSPEGRIALNFRLVQMPPPVRDYVLLHELMHVKQQNHSRRFWRLVADCCPDFRDAERWLRVEGRGLF